MAKRGKAKPAKPAKRKRLTGRELDKRVRAMIDDEMRPYALEHLSRTPAPRRQDEPGHMRRVGGLAVGLTRSRTRVERIWIEGSGRRMPAVTTQIRWAHQAWPDVPWCSVKRRELGPAAVMLECPRRRMDS